ncbi:serine hydrolase domain-containing protein [Streptomyces rishiriensis]|uniref:serine hydrolase domain-containing protein n=1 Tax=Streptomyces rishiriensis TaxID=68264 RepID=UPI000D596AC8|nr:serine hydrolase domain-containing protein [Streptomyces rishiriensis]
MIDSESPEPRVRGHCDERFASVRAAFEENFREREDLGAAVAVRVGGQTVVDLWGGWADAARTRPWERDTLVNVWSTTKGPTALCAHLLADRGQLDLDAPVARYWPEFSAAGKSSVLVRHLLSHRAGLAGLREPCSLAEMYDWELTTARLAAMEPWWEPGTQSGYHALTYGFLVGEVVRRITGLHLGEYLHQEITGPLGIAFTIGLPEKETGRVAELISTSAMTASERAAFAELPPVALASLANPVVTAADANTPEWRAAHIPAANGHGTARAVAALYGIFAHRGIADGGRVLSAQAVERAREGQGAGFDLVASVTGFGHDTELALGMWLSGPDAHYGPNPRAFGHDGTGGSFGLADPEADVSLGYVVNRMGYRIGDDPRKKALVDAVYAAL